MVIGFDGSRSFISVRTGTENYSYQLLISLSKIDIKNQYLIYFKDKLNAQKSWPSNFHFKHINFKRFWTQAGLASKTFKDNLDVLFVPAHTLPVIRKYNLKTVVTVHDLGSEYLPKSHQLKQRLYLSFMQKIQLKGASHLIAVSQATKDDLVKKIGINPKKISVIHEGYNRLLFKPVKADMLVNVLKQYDLVPGSYFLFAGTVQPRKNLKRLIKAFSLFGGAGEPIGKELVIVGSKGWLSDDIYQLPKKLGIEKKVKFLGYAPDKDLPALYGGAIALVFPSLFEGFGLPILEAQACGVPVITSNISSMPEVAGKGAILVDPYSIDDIVEGMIKVNNLDIRKKLIKAGFENVKRFSWEKAASI